MEMEKGRNGRLAGPELLRCIAMMMVVVLHYLDKGKILPALTLEQLGFAGTVSWLLECFCIVAVNTYMLITGYFLGASRMKPGRLVKLYLQVWFYSVGVGAVSVLTGILPIQELTTHDILTMIFPVSMGHYWFITAYVFLFLLLPFVGGAVEKMSKKQLQFALGMMLFFFSVIKTLLPVRMEQDAMGYDCLWYLCVFLTAAYIRKFGLPFLQKSKNCLLLFVGSCLGIFGLTMGLRQIYLATGSLGRMLGVGLEYNHLLPYLAAIGLFGLFLQAKIPAGPGNFAGRIGVYTLGVYLLHENIGLRYAWQKWLGAERIQNAAGLLMWTFLAAVTVFAAGIFADMLRVHIQSGLHRLFGKIKLYRKAAEWVSSADKLFAGEGSSDGV